MKFHRKGAENAEGMPQVNGRELAERMHHSISRLNVLFMSGYTENIMTEQGVLNTGVHFI